MATLYSLYANPRYTMLVTPAGDPMYQITTENGVSSVMRALPKKLGFESEDQRFTVTGTLTWKRPMMFQLGNDRPVPGSQFLRTPVSDSKFKRFMKMAEEFGKREFTGPSGNVYQWTLTGDNTKLRLKGSKEPIAIYTMEHGSLLTSDKRATLVIKEQGLEILDLLILTWVQVALLLGTFKSKGMFASTETEWALASAGTDSANDY